MSLFSLHVSSGFSSLFVSPSPQFVRAPSVAGGGFCFEPVETPFDFDKGALIHLDNHAVFYSFRASKEYEDWVNEYKSYKVAYATGDIVNMASSFLQKHPYLLPVLSDVHAAPCDHS